MHDDPDHWERLWVRTLREHADKVAQRPPSAYLELIAELPPGRALDAGCGHGAETMWLAARGWHVTALDFSPSVLAHAQATAASRGEGLTERIDWREGDLARWAPEAEHFDLVASFYVHIAGTTEEFVQRLARGVAPGGALLLVGHRSIDPETGRDTGATGQRQVTVDEVRAALDPSEWQCVVTEERPRVVVGSGLDTVVLARRTKA